MSAPTVIGLLFIFIAAGPVKSSQPPAWAISSANSDLTCNEWFYGTYNQTTTAFIVPCARSTGTNYTQACANLHAVETNSPFTSTAYRAANASAQLPFCPKSAEMQYDVVSYATHLGHQVSANTDDKKGHHDLTVFNIGIQKAAGKKPGVDDADMWFCAGQTSETMATRGGIGGWEKEPYPKEETDISHMNCLSAAHENRTTDYLASKNRGDKINNYCEEHLPNYNHGLESWDVQDCGAELPIICMMDFKPNEIPTYVNLTAMKEITYKYKSIEGSCGPRPLNHFEKAMKYIEKQPYWKRVLIYIATPVVIFFILYLFCSCINTFYCDEVETETIEQRVQNEIEQAEFRKYVTRPISRGEARI